MKIVAVSDIHASMKAVRVLAEKIGELEPDLTVISGDITHFGTKNDAKRILSEIPGKKVAVPGNCDPPDIVDIFEETETVDIHGKRAEIDGIVFAGLGASNPLPFSTLFTYSEENIYAILDAIAPGTDILVTHTPPSGILDKTMFGHRGGSESIRKIIEKHRPRMALFGHIHESPGIEEQDGILFVNPGPLKKGNFAVVEIDREMRAKRFHLAEK